MKGTITATYRDGLFHPDKPCDLRGCRCSGAHNPLRILKNVKE